MSPELKTPLQLKEIQPLQQNNHQPQVKLLFSSPTTYMLTAPTRAFTRGLYLASQQAALLQFVSFPLQMRLERFSYSFWCMWPSCPNPDLQQKEILSFMVCFTTLTSSSHRLEKEFAEFANSHFAGCFPLGGKARIGKGGKRVDPLYKLL